MNNYTNHSGGALGADSKWDVIGRKYGFNNHVHYYHGSKTPLGNYKLTEEECNEGWDHVLKANLSMKRNPYNYRSLLSRNWFQVKMSDAVFAISSLMKNSLKLVNGGTGWAVQMAIDAGKPVYLFDQVQDAWFKFNQVVGFFEPCEVPVLTENYAGIGTREINENGLRAIEEVYMKTNRKIDEAETGIEGLADS